MEAVYPLTALYWGPVALWYYRVYGRRDVRTPSRQPAIAHADSPATNEARPEHGGKRHDAGDGGSEQQDTEIRWWQVSKGVSHCGAGCTLGDITGEWIVFAFGLTIAAQALYVDYAFDFVLAWSFGIVFQYFSIVPMRKLRPLPGVWAAIKADTFSIIAFQIGLFAGMAVYQLWIFQPALDKSTASYWFLMQLSMIVGFFTAYPVNRWLIAAGWKERM
jgi:hypothetical protein